MLSIKVFKHNTAKDALEFVCEIDTPENLFFTTTLYGSGEFILQINKNKLFADQLTLGRYIVVNSDFRKVGRITDVEQVIDEKGKLSETITVKGNEAKQDLASRIVIPPNTFDYYQITDAIETCIKNVVTGTLGPSADAARQREDITIATDNAQGDTYTMSARYDNLLDVLTKAGEMTGTGFELYIDPVTQTFIFDTIFGVDRTTAQSTNSVVVFSSDYDTLRSAKYTQSTKNFISLAVVGGQGEGAARTIRTVYDTTEPEGPDRYEKFIDARDLALTTELDAKGLEAVTTSTENFLTGKQLTYSNVKFRVDYDIGDLVTVKAFDTSLDAQITEVKESWSQSSYDIDLTFGKQQLRFDTAVRKSAVDTFKLKAV